MKITASTVEELEVKIAGRKHSPISIEPNSNGKLLYCVIDSVPLSLALSAMNAVTTGQAWEHNRMTAREFLLSNSQNTVSDDFLKRCNPDD